MTDTTTTMIQSLSVERLQELLQSMGYRVTVSEIAGRRQLHSATQGIGFIVRPGNPSQVEGEFIDYTVSCALRVEGELPTGVTDAWNIGKRFSRLTKQENFLVLETDVIVAGGVDVKYLRATAELWDRLLQEFVLFLREHADQARANAQVDGDASSSSSEEAAPATEPINDDQVSVERAEAGQA